jgi:O-methyltransferase
LTDYAETSLNRVFRRAYAPIWDVSLVRAQFLIENPNVGTPFNRYMSNTSVQHNAAILDAYDFSRIATLVDIGGGHGGTLAAILGASPGLHGVLFDLPEVVENASYLDAPDIAARSRREGGDMEQGVPAGADAYLLKWVLMDRPDDRAVRLLRHCRTAMTAGGRVLVVEIGMPDDDRPNLGRVMDLQMMLLFGGGRIRTETEFRALFTEAGLAITAVHSTRSPNVIIEGRAIVPE